MRHLKELQEKFIIRHNSRGFTLLHPDLRMNRYDTVIIEETKQRFSEKLVIFAYETEDLIKNRLHQTQKEHNELIKELRMCKRHQIKKDNNNSKEILEKQYENVCMYRDSQARYYNELITSTHDMFNKTIDQELRYIKILANKSKDAGNLQTALEYEDLFKNMISNFEKLVNNVIGEHNTQIIELSESIELEYSELESQCIVNADNNELIIHEIKALKNNSRRLRSHNELKRYLLDNGFEIERYNGSHQIFKNDETGEMRVLPHRQGTYVLAPKTRKNIIDGVNSAQYVE